MDNITIIKNKKPHSNRIILKKHHKIIKKIKKKNYKNPYNFVYNEKNLDIMLFKRYCLIFIEELSVGIIYNNCRTFLYLNIKTNRYYVSIINPIYIGSNEYIGTAVLPSYKRRKILYYTFFDIGLHVQLGYMVDMLTHTITVDGKDIQLCIPF